MLLKCVLLICVVRLAQSKMCDQNFSVAYFKGFCPGGARADSNDWYWYSSRDWEKLLETKWTNKIEERITANVANQDTNTANIVNQKIRPVESNIAALQLQHESDIAALTALLNQAKADVAALKQAVTDIQNASARTQSAVDEWYNEKQAQIAKDLAKKRNSHSTIPEN